MKRKQTLGRSQILLALALVAASSMGVNMRCASLLAGPVFISPETGLLTTSGDVVVAIQLPPAYTSEAIDLRLDGSAVALQGQSIDPGTQQLTGTLAGMAAGSHRLEASLELGGTLREGETTFTTADFDRPDLCDVLHQVECMLPFPSQRYQVPDAGTETGVRTLVPFGAAPTIGHLVNISPIQVVSAPADTTASERNDGTSPMAQILVHFPGVDLAASNAPVIDPKTRYFTSRALAADSPIVLFDAATGEQVNLWAENDARATDPERVMTFVRPTVSLKPGGFYIAAFRNLVDGSGAPIVAEPAFANIRDRGPSDIPAVNARRAQIDPLLDQLEGFGVDRASLVLAFGFRVMSDESLAGEMLQMRDEAFSWLDAQIAADVQTFTALVDVQNDCAVPGTLVHRIIDGTFEAPNFLDNDPVANNTELGFLNRNASDEPEQNGFTNVPYSIAIPCDVFTEGGIVPVPSIVLGHGLFGSGPGFVDGLADAQELGGFPFAAGGVNWLGLSSSDIGGCDLDTLNLDCFIVKVLGDLDNMPALADRMRQGMLHALILARMMDQGAFNLDPLFQEGGQGLLDTTADPVYFGASLGGIMGTMFSALTPDVQRLNVDVPGVNFSLLLQRATPFLQFQLLFDLLVNPDPLQQALGLSLTHEVWVRGEPAGYVTHVTGDNFPGVAPKQILMTVARYDQQVSNLAAAISAASMGLPNHEGSAVFGVPGVPDSVGDQPSAHIVYDTGRLDPSIPGHLPFVPPITNLQAEPNGCDPHGVRGFVPASVDQLFTFLDGGGIVNFCDGRCDARDAGGAFDPNEIPFGNAVPCDPLS